MGRLFDSLPADAPQTRIDAAIRELIDDAEASAFCRETLLMLATNYAHAAAQEQGARAQALRAAAGAIRDDA